MLHDRVEEPELRLLHRWLDNWRGVGLVAAGLHTVGYDLVLRKHGEEGWSASFFITGGMHSWAARRRRQPRGARCRRPAGRRSSTPNGSMGPLTDAEAFVHEHRAHGALTGDASESTAHGYLIEIACPCGLTFSRWVLPTDAAVDLAALVRLN